MSDWLEDLKEGDEVAVAYYCGYGKADKEQVRRVSRVTGAWIFTECGEKYNRTTRLKTGIRSPARQSITRLWSEKLETEERAKYCDKIRSFVNHYECKPTTEQLRRICAILDEAVTPGEPQN